MNVRVLGKGLELLNANGGRFEINQLLFAGDTALVADSEEKLCRLVTESGRACEIRKLRVNVGKSKVLRCSRYGNGDRMHVIIIIIIILLKQDYKVQLANNKVQMAWLTCWLVVG